MIIRVGVLVCLLLSAMPAQASLSVSATNPRWIVNSTTGKAVYFSSIGGGPEGSLQFNATFRGLQDIQRAAPVTTDFTAALASVRGAGLNHMRLWQLEQRAWASAAHFKDGTYLRVPIDQLPYLLTGSRIDRTTGVSVAVGVYDLSRFSQDYFDRMRSRVQEALAAGVYPSVMLFSSGHLEYDDYSIGHPYQAANNANGIDADMNGNGKVEETMTLVNPRITAFQDEYICKFVDTFKDIGGVMFEVTNEVQGRGSEDWQSHVMDQIRECERQKGSVRHLVMQSAYDFGHRTDNDYLFNNPRPDIVMPTCTSDGTNYETNPPASPAEKPIRWYDTDHVGLRCSTIGADVPWRNFTRAVYFGFLNERETEAVGAQVRAAQAQTIDWANTRIVNLLGMVPETGTSICESGYCLYNPDGSEFLMYLPSAERKYIDLSSWTGQYSVQFFNPADGTTTNAAEVQSKGSRLFAPPWNGAAVVYLKRTQSSQ
ncbi:MAG: putative collagen-binding domain-containing protein [Nitrospira sp.]|nr:putative collagen-binding domain-containing protein [Nitrospira sp.]